MAPVILLVAGLFSGCSKGTAPEQLNPVSNEQQVTAAGLFDQITRDYHLPSAEAEGEKRASLLAQAASGYERLLKEYPQQPFWAAQALRSLGNVRAVQGRLDEALALYDRVAKEYPKEDWEIIQSWKSAADILEDRGDHELARAYFQKIVDRFDQSEQPAVIQATVRGSKRRLQARSTEP